MSISNFKRSAVCAAVMALFGMDAFAQYAYSNDDVVPQQSTRAVNIQASKSIQGCDAGLMMIDGAYWCKSLVPQFRGGTAPNSMTSSSMGGGGGASESHAWGVPGMTGGFDVGYNDMGQTDPGNEGSAGAGSSNGRVICTHFFRKGEIDRSVWRADIEFTAKHLSPTTVRGYHYWAIPYVRLMRRSKLAEDIMRPLALARARELAFQMGSLESGSLFGKMVRMTLEPVCFLIGVFVEQKEFASLWQGLPALEQPAHIG